MPRQKLTDGEIERALVELAPWAIRGNKLHRDFEFGDFAQAIGFITIAAIHIEKRNHHPEWFNVYKRVSVDLTTHDAGGITSNDIELARLLNSIASKFA